MDHQFYTFYCFIFLFVLIYHSDNKNKMTYSSVQVVALVIVSHGYCVIDSFD